MTEKTFSLRMVQLVDYENDQRWSFPFNLYPFHTLYLVEAGDGFIRVGDEITALHPGHACLIPAYTLYSCWCKSHIKKIYIEFFLDSPSGLNVFFDQDMVSCRQLPEGVLSRVRALQGDRSLKNSMRLEGELLCILSQFISQSCLHPAKDLTRFQPLLMDIRANLSSGLQVAELAGKHGFNPTFLSRSFRRALHCTPKQYIQQLLANVLKNELLHTEKSLAQLADEYHFCDAYYLSNFFKRLIGISPQHYRRAMVLERFSGSRVFP